MPFSFRSSLDATIIGPDIFVVSHCCHFSKCFVNKILDWNDIRCLVNVWIKLHVLHYRELFRGHNSWLFKLAFSFSIWTNDLRNRFLYNKCWLLLNIYKKKGISANVKKYIYANRKWSIYFQNKMSYLLLWVFSLFGFIGSSIFNSETRNSIVKGKLNIFLQF